MAFVQYFIRQLTSELELAVSAVELYDNSLRVSLKIAAPPCSARAAALGALTADAQTEVTCCHNNSLQKREVLRLGRKSQRVLTSASVSFFLPPPIPTSHLRSDRFGCFANVHLPPYITCEYWDRHL